MQPPERVAKLVLVRRTGEVLGQLPPFPVTTPWWQDIGPVVTAAKERHGLDVTVLRLLEAELPAAPGGRVTYLAETADSPHLEPWHGTLDEHPLRASYARPGGPAADLAWADRMLADRGMKRIAPAEQVRTWNLSSLWRLPVRGEVVWLKVVPPFFGHEGAMLARLAGGPVPSLLARDGCRVLMREVPGSDLYGAGLLLLLQMVPLLVRFQRDEIGRVDELLALGLPDAREEALAAAIADVVERTSAELTEDDRTTLARFVDDLPERFRRVHACGLPDTLVHGDFHPGNVRGDGASLVVLDWGDSAVGHPLLDQAAFLGRIRDEEIEPVRAVWNGAWRAAIPGCDPERAARLLGPVAVARQAVVYRHFLDCIEPSEHPYHRADPSDRLRHAAAILRAPS